MSIKVVSYLNSLNHALKIIALTVLLHLIDSVRDEMPCNYFFLEDNAVLGMTGNNHFFMQLYGPFELC